jgi:hypothetical protein
MFHLSPCSGKSITLAVVSMVMALLGFRVSVACYSKDLSSRDEAAFKAVFCDLGLQQAISYGTFDALCEQAINNSGNIRNMALERLTAKAPMSGASAAAASPSKAAPAKDDDEIVTPGVVPLKDRPLVLLVDEVDVFFDKSASRHTHLQRTRTSHAHLRTPRNEPPAPHEHSSGSDPRLSEPAQLFCSSTSFTAHASCFSHTAHRVYLCA